MLPPLRAAAEATVRFMLPFDGAAEPQTDDAVIGVECWASRLARLVLLLTYLADRHDAAGLDAAGLDASIAACGCLT